MSNPFKLPNIRLRALPPHPLCSRYVLGNTATNNRGWHKQIGPRAFKPSMSLPKVHFSTSQRKRHPDAARPKRICTSAQITGRSRRLTLGFERRRMTSVHVDRVSATFIIPSMFKWHYVQYSFSTNICLFPALLLTLPFKYPQWKCSCISAFASLLEKYLGGCRGDAFYEATLICWRGCFVTQLEVIDLNCRRYRMKPANSPVIRTSRSLNQSLLSRAAAFVMTALKYENHSLKLIFQFQLSGDVSILDAANPNTYTSEHPSQSLFSISYVWPRVEKN